MSPTGGAFQEEFVQSGSDTGLMDDGQMRQQEQRQSAEARGSPAENNTSAYDYARVRSQTRTSDQQKEASSARNETPRSGGGAWDRIRHDAMSGSAKPSDGPSRRPTQQQSRSSADSGDSFAFSQGDEDKQLAQSEAQKDFDARIERERSGKDFEDQGNRSRRW